MQSLGDAVGRQLVEVLALEAVSPGEHQHRVGPVVAGQLVHQVLALGGGELAGSGLVLGVGPAVLAHQSAGPGHLPDDDEGLLGQVVLDLADQRMAAGVAGVTTGVAGLIRSGDRRGVGRRGWLSGTGHGNSYSEGFDVRFDDQLLKQSLNGT